MLTKKYGIEASEARVLTKKLLNRTDGAISVGFPNRGLIFINGTAARRIAPANISSGEVWNSYPNHDMIFLNGTLTHTPHPTSRSTASRRCEVRVLTKKLLNRPEGTISVNRTK